MRRPDLHRPATVAVGALALAGMLTFAAPTLAQEAAAPRYMNWSGRGPAVMPQGVQTASNEAATPRRPNTPIPHGGFARAVPSAAPAPMPARRTLTPASAWITPGASYGAPAAVAPAPVPTVYAAPAEARDMAAAPTPAPAPTPVEARVDLPPPPRAPSYSPTVAPQPQIQAQAQRQDDRQFLPEYMAGQGGAQPAPSQAVYADSPRPAAPAAAPTYADQGAPSDAADPMAPRRDAPIFRLQRPALTGPAPIPGPSASTENTPAAPVAEAAPARRQLAAVTANPSDHPEMQASRRYSVHRQNGQQPDAVSIPQPTYVDALAVTLTDMPAGRDLAEPAPGPNLYRDNQGRVRAAPAASDGDHQ